MNKVKTKQGVPFFEDDDSKRRPGFPTIERATVNVILWDPKTEKVVGLHWEKLGLRTFIIGGIENRESPEETAIREIAEETGYTDVKFVTRLGQHQSAYFAAHKKENRIANTTGLLFVLISRQQKVIDTAVPLPHIFRWIPRRRVSSFLTLSSQKYLWKRAQLCLL